MAATARNRLIILILLGAGLLAARLLFRPTAPPLTELLPVLRVAVDASSPPFAVATENDLYGFEIDLARALGERLGVPVQFVSMTFDGLYDSLQADQVDIVLANVSIDPRRTNEVYYTQAYFNAGLVLVSPGEQAIESMEQLPGHSLAYEFGSAADSLARGWLRRLQPFATRPYELPTYALDAVRHKAADAALVEMATALLYLREYPDWPVSIHEQTFLPYVGAIRLDRPWLWREVDKALKDLIDDGTLATIRARWF